MLAEVEVTVWGELESKPWDIDGRKGLVNTIEVVDGDMNKFKLRFDNDEAAALKQIPKEWEKRHRTRIIVRVDGEKIWFVGVSATPPAAAGKATAAAV